MLAATFIKPPALSSAINESALKAFIKANPNHFSSGEDMAIFYFLMTDKNYIGTSKKDFHSFISSLIECVGYTQLSNACVKVKPILNDKWHDANAVTSGYGSTQPL